MTYTENGDLVTLGMTRDEFAIILLAIGQASGLSLQQNDRHAFYSWLAFANRLNRSNPGWRPYEIPEEFCPECHKAKAHAWSDATTPGFFFERCEEHRKGKAHV